MPISIFSSFPIKNNRKISIWFATVNNLFCAFVIVIQEVYIPVKITSIYRRIWLVGFIVIPTRWWSWRFASLPIAWFENYSIKIVILSILHVPKIIIFWRILQSVINSILTPIIIIFDIWLVWTVVRFLIFIFRTIIFLGFTIFVFLIAIS